MNRGWLVGIAVVALVVVGYLIFHYTSFRLIASSPKNNSTSVAVVTPLSFTFSETLSSTRPVFTSQPTFDGLVSVIGSTATLKASAPLQFGTKYTITLRGITSGRGRSLPSVALTFTTVSLGVSEANLRQNLPHNADQFSVDYISTNQTYSVTILSEPIDAAHTAALAYLVGFGVTPATSQIVFSNAAGVGGSVGP